MDGRGHFFLDGAVEDSATAEISRSQIWQWIYHQVLKIIIYSCFCTLPSLKI